MTEITNIIGRQILDSRGNPTVEVVLFFKKNSSELSVSAAVPSGASTGSLEAIELRDGTDAFNGKGVTTAINNIKIRLREQIIGQDCTKQEDIDNLMLELDGTDNKSELGANAILGVSMAVARAGAIAKGVHLYEHLGALSKTIPQKLPIPVFNVINGGAHAGNALDFQEFMIIPSGAKSYSEALQIGAETYAALKKILRKKYGPDATNLGDEGGFAPPLKDVKEPFQLLLDTLKEVGYDDKVKLGIDVAASEFYENENYTVNGEKLDSSGLLDLYKELVDTYLIVSIEDPFDEEDWQGFTDITSELGNKIQIVGDDLFVTNINRIKMGIEKSACNSVLLKVNQIGSVTESINAALYSFENDYGIMVSHRSGETEDNFIADLAVALNCGQIKSGAPARSDRTSKYNQLLRIEEMLGSAAKYGSVKYLSG